MRLTFTRATGEVETVEVAEGVRASASLTRALSGPVHPWYADMVRQHRGAMRFGNTGIGLDGENLDERTPEAERLAWARERAAKLLARAKLKAQELREQAEEREEGGDRSGSELPEDGDGAGWFDDRGFASMDSPSMQGPMQRQRHLTYERVSVEDRCLVADGLPAEWADASPILAHPASRRHEGPWRAMARLARIRQYARPQAQDNESAWRFDE